MLSPSPQAKFASLYYRAAIKNRKQTITEPDNALGHTLSDASFTVSPMDEPAWARHALYGLGDKQAEQQGHENAGPGK